MAKLPQRAMIAYLLTGWGILGTIIALITEQSDYDPVAFGLAAVSILVAVIGISLAFKLPSSDKRAKPSVP